MSDGNFPRSENRQKCWYEKIKVPLIGAGSSLLGVGSDSKKPVALFLDSGAFIPFN